MAKVKKKKAFNHEQGDSVTAWELCFLLPEAKWKLYLKDTDLRGAYRIKQERDSADRNIQLKRQSKWTQLYQWNSSLLEQKCGPGVWGEFPCCVSVA